MTQTRTTVLKELSIFGGKGKTMIELDLYDEELERVGEPAFVAAFLRCANDPERGNFPPSIVELRKYMPNGKAPRNPSPPFYSVDGQYGGQWPKQRGGEEMKAIAEFVWLHPDNHGHHTNKQAEFVRFLGFEPSELPQPVQEVTA